MFCMIQYTQYTIQATVNQYVVCKVHSTHGAHCALWWELCSVLQCVTLLSVVGAVESASGPTHQAASSCATCAPKRLKSAPNIGVKYMDRDDTPKQPKQLLCIAQCTGHRSRGETESVCENHTFPGTITRPSGHSSKHCGLCLSAPLMRSEDKERDGVSIFPRRQFLIVLLLLSTSVRAAAVCVYKVMTHSLR